MRISVNKAEEKCTGCNLCAMVCSVFHFGEVNLGLSAIRVTKDDLGKSESKPRVCMQCKNPRCLEKENDKESIKKEFEWPVERMANCPFEGLHVKSNAMKLCLHCDLCGGDPQCIKICSTNAIRLIP